MIVTDTLAMLYINSTSVSADIVATLASACEKENYAALELSHTFFPNANKTIGSIGLKASSFFTGIWLSPISCHWYSNPRGGILARITTDTVTKMRVNKMRLYCI